MKSHELSNKIYYRAKDTVLHELDVVNLFNSIRKLKAGLAAVIDDDHSIMERTKEIYFSQSTIYANAEDEVRYQKGYNMEIYKFF